jgi:hypothetical protein
VQWSGNLKFLVNQLLCLFSVWEMQPAPTVNVIAVLPPIVPVDPPPMMSAPHVTELVKETQNGLPSSTIGVIGGTYRLQQLFLSYRCHRRRRPFFIDMTKDPLLEDRSEQHGSLLTLCSCCRTYLSICAPWTEIHSHQQMIC